MKWKSIFNQYAQTAKPPEWPSQHHWPIEIDIQPNINNATMHNPIKAEKWDSHVEVVMARVVGVKDKFFDQVGCRVKQYILKDRE